MKIAAPACLAARSSYIITAEFRDERGAECLKRERRDALSQHHSNGDREKQPSQYWENSLNAERIVASYKVEVDVAENFFLHFEESGVFIRRSEIVEVNPVSICENSV